MTNRPTYTGAELDAAKFSPLTAQPTSIDAIRLCGALASALFREAKQRPNVAKRLALGALVADLLEREPSDQGGWLYRATASGSFSGGPVGYRPFIQVLEALARDGMAEAVTGNRVWTQSELTGGKRAAAWQKATRYRATNRLRECFSAGGITREGWARHFERESGASSGSATPSVILRAAKPENARPGTKARNMVPDPTDPTFLAMTARMDRLNAYLSEQTFAPFGPVILRRIFANGDDTAFAWDQGGRISPLGTETYQTAKKPERASITINGMQTVELDLRASHLTILVGLGHVPLSVLDDDPYTVEGLPREIVKQWITMTLSHGKRHRTWPQAFAAEYQSKNTRRLSDDFPLRRTGDLILSKLPIIGEDGKTSPVGWADLQYRESEILLQAMEELAFEHDVPGLPVHDSLIVPQEAKALASSILGNVFAEQVGIIPQLA